MLAPVGWGGKTGRPAGMTLMFPHGRGDRRVTSTLPLQPEPVPDTSVHAIVPLSLLEAMRNIDTPVDDGLNEIAEEIVAKRLGLSATVASQIERYRKSSLRDGTVSLDEAVSVFRLVGRRSDASLVYADAGRRAARLAARRASGVTRALLRLCPRPLRRRLGRRTAAVVASGVLGAELRPRNGGAEVELRESLATGAGFEGTGCEFYAKALAELLRVLSGFEGAMVHDRCRSKGDGYCCWRTATAEGYE